MNLTYKKCPKNTGFKKEPDFQDIVWCFIRPIQSNKTPLIAQHTIGTQSRSHQNCSTSLSTAPGHLPNLNVCLQVNISAETQKFGFAPAEIEPAAAQIAHLPHLNIRGLMAIAQKSSNSAQIQQQFHHAQNHQDLQQRYPSIDTLSLGMSHDFPQAIQAGSTLFDWVKPFWPTRS